MTLSKYADLVSLSSNGRTDFCVQLSRSPNNPPPGYVFVPKGDIYITRQWYRHPGVSPKVLSDIEQPKTDEKFQEKAMDRLCRVPKPTYCFKLTVCKDPKSNEKLGIHCFQQIVEAVREDAAATGTFI